MITVLIPTLLRTITDGQDRILTWPGNVRAIIEDINTRFPGFKVKIYEDTGKVRRGINLFVNEEDIRFLDGLDTLLSSSSGDVLDIVPAIAGGRVSTEVTCVRCLKLARRKYHPGPFTARLKELGY